MFVGAIGRGAQRIIDAMVRWLAYGHINPNFLTVIGVAINVGSGLLFGYGMFSGPEREGRGSHLPSGHAGGKRSAGWINLNHLAGGEKFNGQRRR